MPGSDLLTRVASPADGMAISTIYNTAIAERKSTFEMEPRSAADFDERIGSDAHPLLVAEVDGRVVGWAGVSPYSSRPCYAGIAECSVYVAHAARGHGVGTMLADALAGAAESHGFHKLTGKLFTDNMAAIKLCERCGFTRVGVHRRHGRLEGEWRDVLVVERLLASDRGAAANQTD